MVVLLHLPLFLSDSLFSVSEGVCGDIEERSHIWRIDSLFGREEYIFLPGYDVPGVSISGVGIIFDAFGASNDLGAELP